MVMTAMPVIHKPGPMKILPVEVWMAVMTRGLKPPNTVIPAQETHQQQTSERQSSPDAPHSKHNTLL
jgi:hypothetical protein